MTRLLNDVLEELGIFSCDKYFSSVIAPWLDQALRLDKHLQKLHKTLVKKKQQIDDLSSSFVRYEEDSIELTSWLHKKEMEFDEMEHQYNEVNNMESMHFLDKCQVFTLLYKVLYIMFM